MIVHKKEARMHTFLYFLLLSLALVNSTSLDRFTEVGDRLYLIDHNHKLNWFAAMKHCMQMDAHLATISNTTEMEALSDYLMSQGFRPAEWMWISGFGMPGSFFTFTNGTTHMPYAKWWNNQPNGSGHCVSLHRKHNQYYMDDWNCKAATYFICEA